MELTIHTYGHIDAMFYILNGIAMILGSSFADLLIQTMSLVAVFYFGLKAAYSGASAKQHLVKVAGLMIVVNSLLIPKTSMIVKDYVTKQRDKIDNLPYGFAIPVGYMENFGDIITNAFEQAFTAVGSSNYKDYGMVFGARLLQEARNWRIKTPEFSHNMDNFIRRCVVYDASMGYKYTINDLFETDDVWGLVSSKASPLRRVEMKKEGISNLWTCKEAAALVIAPAFTSELERIKAKYIKSDFGKAGSVAETFDQRGTIGIRSFFKQNIEKMTSRYLGNGSSAESSLRQFMMINSLGDYGRNYGYARASMTQESNWRIAGDLANMYLPILLSVIKGLVYASFIFMVPLMLLSGGMQKYLGYITVVASLQLWPALNAILNMFIDTYSSHNLQDIAGGVISFTSYSKVGDYSDKIVAVASSLQMVIPYLAFTIVQGGVSGFIQLAGNITGASQSAAGQAAQELTTNNKSFDNYSSGNMQYAMQQGFKTDFNSSYRSGASESQNMDGSLEKLLPDGNIITQSGPGLTMSGGGVKFNMKNAISGQVAQNLSSAKNMLESEQVSSHDAERSSVNKTAGYDVNLAKRESQGETIDHSTVGEEGKSYQKAVNHVNTLRSQYGYGYDQASEMALRGGANGSAGNFVGGLINKGLEKIGLPNLPAGVMSKGGGGDVTFGLDGNVRASNNSSQQVGDDNQINTEQFTREDYNSVARASKSEQFAASNNIDTSYSDDIRSSYENQQSLERSRNMQADRVDSLSKGLSTGESVDGTQDKDMWDEVQKRVESQYRVDYREAARMMEKRDPRVDKVWSNMVKAEASKVIGADMKAAQISYNDGSRFAKLDEAERKYKPRINQDYQAPAKQEALNHGLDTESKGFVQNNVSRKVEDMMIDNSHFYQSAKQENTSARDDLHGRVDQYEKDRIGQGRLGKRLGIGGPTNPSTIKTKPILSERAIQIKKSDKE